MHVIPTDSNQSFCGTVSETLRQNDAKWTKERAEKTKYGRNRTGKGKAGL